MVEGAQVGFDDSMKFQIDWDGYTIGYYGRIFEARNKTKGGSFVVLNSPLLSA